ncbi:MAG: rod shape-determining protein MreC [Candidatus Limnocylindrales bacterium]
MTRSARRQTAAYVALLALAMLLLAFGNSGPLLEFRRGVGFALTPIQDTLRTGTRTVTSLFGALGEIDTLRQQNEQLTQRIQALETDNQRLQGLEIENKRLSDLLGTKTSLTYDTVAAEVTNQISTGQERVISLDHGTDSGIDIFDPVVASGGALIGLVVEVGPNFSRVQLVTDSRTNVAGLIDSTRAIGLVKGQGERPLEMTNIPAADAIAVGESVVTAGIELDIGIRSTYPKGLLIGTIVHIDRQPDQLFQTALVQPATVLDRLEYVLVITSYDGGLPEDSPSPGSLPGAAISPAPSVPATTPPAATP